MTAKKRIIRKAVPGYSLIPKNGYYQAKKIGITGKRVKTDPVFANTRRNAAEFGYTAKIAKIIRAALMENRVIVNCFGRLTSVLLEAVKTDNENIAGERNLLRADLSLLAGFEFNPQHPWSECCQAHITITRLPPREIQVLLPDFVPAFELQHAGNPGHFRITFRLMTMDIETSGVVTTSVATRLLPYNTTPVRRRCFTFDEKEGDNYMHIICGYIEWFKIVNGHPEPMAQYTATILAAWNGCTKKKAPDE